MKIRYIFFLFLFGINAAFAQLKSPGEFLGYEPGTRYTQHYKIVDYFTAAAAAMPGMMQLEKYGQTNEGRDLLLAIVTSINQQPIEESKSLSHIKTTLKITQNLPSTTNKVIKQIIL